VLATQTSRIQEGPLSLPEAQLDRFLIEIDVDSLPPSGKKKKKPKKPQEKEPDAATPMGSSVRDALRAETLAKSA